MKSSYISAFALAIVSVSAQGSGGQGSKTTGGTGPYTAYYFEDATLPNHTIYQPKDPSKVGTKLPVIAWANGACSQDGISFASFLAQVASHGALAIAVGTIKGIPNTGAPPGSGTGGMSIWPERQRAAIDWAVKNAGKGNYTHVDGTRIAVWGQSCGGVESYANWNDSRVNSVGIFHSGLMSEAETKSTAGKINKPIFYFLGGPNDIAYKNGERDYAALPAGTPAWIGNDALGHGGAFNQLVDAGYFGIAGTRYMQWVLRGNETAGEWFKDGSAIKAGFKDEKKKSLENIKVTPIQ
ncbi:hypothetical protein IQ07DRAFT_675406 [Pyrenochaeta sp. DS3sAY3a]|nr:hypothetical protein IQ07DRAFT_675406 [Pyrenochaeta sp. DS3sAY3a]